MGEGVAHRVKLALEYMTTQNYAFSDEQFLDTP